MQARISLGIGFPGPVVIPDLHIRLSLGESVWTDSDHARNSACLRALVQTGNVRVSYERRDKRLMSIASNPPRPTVPSVMLSRPQVQRPVASLANTPPMDVDKLAKAISDALAATRPAGPDAGAMASMIENAVERAISRLAGSLAQTGYSGGPQNYANPVNHDDPVYIPTGIVGDSPVEIKTTAVTSAAGDLEDAARALKAVNRPKRVRKSEAIEEQD